MSETSGGLSFLVVAPQAPVGFFILGHEFRVGNVEGDNPYDSGVAVGTVAYTLRSPQPDPQPGPHPDPAPDDGAAAVPEPSEIAGSAVALGLLGVGWYRRRSKAVVMDQNKNR
ncbi:PEP-CTERM sorting domain-containing protein [Leptodesmis sp.]|uniref:PEP-CTERM sorting domain-containing protein n=1 Tax=Leptodesmis sp. TaxID=3100501 RepID=UPI0040535936